MTDQERKAAEMALDALEKGTTGLAIRAIPALRQALAQDKQRENRMTDREAIQKALDTPHRRYSIKPHGNGYAIYRDRDLFHHGFNIGHLTEVTPETIELIENALNTTLAQPEQEPVCTKIEGNQFETFKVRYEDAVKLKDLPVGTKLYTAPPSKPWVSLTDEEIVQIVRERGWGQSYFSLIEIIEFTRDNEAALRSKNDSVG